MILVRAVLNLSLSHQKSFEIFELQYLEIQYFLSQTSIFIGYCLIVKYTQNTIAVLGIYYAR